MIFPDPRRLRTSPEGPTIHRPADFERIVSPTPLPPSDARPIFILGSVRSGTSVVVNAIKDGAGIPGHYEENVAALMQRLFDVVRDFFANFSPSYLAAKSDHLIGSLDPADLNTWIKNYFAAFYEVKLGSGRWVAKSPDSYLFAPMVRASRHLMHMFPKAKFLFCLRRGIENVLSRQKKFRDVPFGHHCRSWAHTVDEWLKVKPILGDRGFEVRQRDIATQPRKLADELTKFLDLTTEQRNGIVRVFEGPRAEQIHVASEHREIGLDETPWDENHRTDFLRFCGPAMEAAGFSVEGRSIPVEAPVRLFYPSVRTEQTTKNVHPEWGFGEVDPQTFQIHPNEPGQPPAEVRWPAILSGESRLVADVQLGHADSEPVVIEVRIEDSATRTVKVKETSTISKALEWKRFTVSFPPLSGAFDVVISTRMAPGAKSSSYAWAQFKDAHLR